MYKTDLIKWQSVSKKKSAKNVVNSYCFDNYMIKAKTKLI